MALQRKIERREQLLTANGSIDGRVTVDDSEGFFVGQKATLSSNTISSQQFTIFKVVGPNYIYLTASSDVVDSSPANLQAYLVADGAKITQNEAQKFLVQLDEVEQYTHENAPVLAKRVVIVDEYGNKINKDNPLAVDIAQVDIGDISIGTDGFDQNNPDSMLGTGSEDGTKTGTKHALKIDSDGDLHVAITNGVEKASISGGELSVHDQDSVDAIQNNGSILSNINSTLSTGTINVSDGGTQSTLGSILNQLENGSIALGTEDGTVNGVARPFVNNIRLQILAAKDRDQAITYADFGTKDQRITSITYTAPSIGSGAGFTAIKTISYTLIGTKYRRDNITWSIA